MLDDAFAIQSEVARQIVTAVGVALTVPEQAALATVHTANPEAYQLYLQGRDYYNRPGRLQQNHEIAQQLYEQALALDPDFALAHAALSQVHGRMHWLRYDPSPMRVQRMWSEAEAAVRLAPDLPQAHIAMGSAHYWGHRDWRRALAEFTIVLRGLPNDAEAWAHLGYVHRRLGNWDSVLAAFETAAQLNPRQANLIWDLGGNTYHSVRRYADAIRAYDRALSLAPDLHVAAVLRGWSYAHWHGQLDTLRAVLSRLPRDAEAEGFGTRTSQLLQLLLWERQAHSLLSVLEVFTSSGRVRFGPSASGLGN